MSAELARLIRQIQGSACVLFLGAGACISSGSPTSRELADELAKHFFDDASGRFDLCHVCEYIETNLGRKDLEKYLIDRFERLEPRDGMLEIPKYTWRAIFTVNFDNLLEKSYERTNAGQKLHTILSDADDITNIPSDRVCYYKLHGCLSRCRTESGRLTLTSEDYAHAAQNRSRAYHRLTDFLADSTILYIGFALNDQDFRRLLQQLKASFVCPQDQRRTYALFPGCQEIDCKRWEHEKISLLNLDCDQFFQHLNETIPEPERVLPKTVLVGPEAPDILTKLPPTASELIGTLKQNYDFIDSRIHKSVANINDFFKGATPTWGTIAKRIPAKRDIEDELMQEILVDDAIDEPKPNFFLINAEGGSGKSTLIRILAAELCETWQREVLFLRPNGFLDYFSVEHFTQLVGRRTYICIDNATTRARELSEFLQNAKRSELKITVIATARTNEWDDAAEGLLFPSESRFELELLSRNEIDGILNTLENTGNLGLLGGLKYEQQVHAFEKLAQKQLLVALREATEGRLFDEIVLDEFNQVPSETAKTAYLAICALHWLGIPVRVSLLRRLSRVAFTDLADEVLTPAKGVIVPYDCLDTRESVYGARHTVIARIVFWGIVASGEARLDFYRRFFSSIDLGYESDRSAFKQITRTRSKDLMTCFNTYELRNEFFELASAVDSTDAYIYQHRAMMALAEKGDKVEEALAYISEARRLHPNDLTIRDTHARALVARGTQKPWITARTTFAEAENILSVNVSRVRGNPYSYLTLSELYEALSTKSEDADEKSTYLRKAYEVILEGIDRCNMRAMLWHRQGVLEQRVGTIEGAREAFRKVLVERPSDAVTRILYAKLEENEGNIPEAIKILSDGLTHAGHDMRLRHILGLLLLKHQPSNTQEIESHLKAAVVIPSNDYRPRYDLACFLFQNGNYPEAYQHFDILSSLDIPRLEAYQMPWVIKDESGNAKDFAGKVLNLHYDYGFISCEFPREIYFSRWSLKAEGRKNVAVNKDVTFNTGFNMRGPVAINISVL